MWLICNKIGRDGWTGRLRAEAVTATLAAVDGEAEDLEKILTIEQIAEDLRPETDDEPPDHEPRRRRHKHSPEIG